MQTQCPHCETRFRVTETQVNIADGLVRCGVCKEIFNALEVAGDDEHQPSLLDDNHALAEVEQEISIDHPGLAGEESLQTSREQQKIEEYESEIQAEIQIDYQPADFKETPTKEESEKDTFDFFDETVNESLTYVVPEKFRDTYPGSSHSVISTLLWSAGILLLTATLLIEYAWFNRDQINHIPELQVWMEKICLRVDCRNIAMRDPSKIELVTRNVYSHPNEKNALMVNVTMKNNADFAQPYPVMQIEFSDVRGGTVAARRFLPAEYLPIESLPKDAKQSPLLQPNTSSSITMEIQDPGKQAMTYEFNFL